ncbi:BrnT family toxin [Laspinema olomoucense]|uniref:BrnT family toxin n=1 Tax=Laspinema olomoucense D3b TaxID=2953688 RepID=A0ABT2NJM6_9CYAN|nr:BrnT family toxin [Laspinema sp. D3b]MCT7981501.1 BrnT family toxin [Laspinema sp. D3b]
MQLRFEWHEEKAQNNLKKHGISFEEAKTVFNDPLSITIADTQHSDNEERYIDIGRSSQGQLLVVVYTERQANIRIISCRQATKTERKIYEQS